jgi:integrase
MERRPTVGKPRKEFSEGDARKLGKPGTLKADPQSVNLSIRYGKTVNSYLVMARAGGKQRWVTIGRVGDMSLEQARAKAREVVQAIKAGPAASVAPQAKTLAMVVTDWLEVVGRHQLRRREKERRLNRILLPAFGDRVFAEIDHTELVLLLDKIVAKGHRRTADMVKVDFTALEKFYVERTRGATIQVGGRITKRSKTGARKRVLDNDELRSVWTAAGNGVSDGDRKFGAIVKLLILVPQRREKIISMQWSDIKGTAWTVPHRDGEKGVPERPLRLPPAAIDLIQAQEIEIDGQRHRASSYVFPAARGDGCIRGLSGYKLALEARMDSKIPQWSLHDLRRTSRSLMPKAKGTVTLKDGTTMATRIDGDVAEALLGHVTPGVRGVYERPDLEQEVGEALALLADHVLQIVGDNVLSLPLVQGEGR